MMDGKSLKKKELIITTKFQTMFFYNPRISDHDVCFNYTDYNNQFNSNEQMERTIEKESKMNAVKLPGTSVILTHDLKTSFYSGGGLRLILPLFYLLDQPTLDSKEPNYSIDTRLLPLVIELLIKFIGSSSDSFEQMSALEGPKLISNFLTKISPQHFTVEAVESISKLVDILVSRESTKFSTYRDIILNFSMVTLIDIQAQKKWMHMVNRLVLSDLKYFNNNFGTQFVLDSLRIFFWFKPEPSLKFSDTDIEFYSVRYHPITHDCLGKRPNEISLKIIRYEFLNVLKIVFSSEELTENDVCCVLNYLVNCNDEEQLEDVLNFFLYFSTYPKEQSKMVRVIEKFGLHCLFPLLSCRHQEVRYKTLDLVSKVFVHISNHERNRLIKNYGFHSIVNKLSTYPITFKVIQYLFVMAIGGSYQSNNSSENELFEIPNSQYTFANPDMIGVIFQLLLLAPESLQVRTLEHVNSLLSQSNQALEVFLSQPLWQNWIMSVLLICKKFDIGNLSSDLERSFDSVIWSMVNKIFTLCHFYAMTNLDRGYKVIERTKVVLFNKMSGEKYVYAVTQIYQQLFFKLLKDYGKLNNSLVVSRNISLLITEVVEDDIFGNIQEEKIFQDTNIVFHENLFYYNDTKDPKTEKNYRWFHFLLSVNLLNSIEKFLIITNNMNFHITQQTKMGVLLFYVRLR